MFTSTSRRRFGLVALAAGTALGNAALAQDTKTIKIATHYNQQQFAPLQACLTQYEAENSGIKIVHNQASYRDFMQTILTARVGGTAPDIYNIYSIWAPQLVESSTLDTPPEDVQAFVREGYGKGSVEAASVDGTLYGIPTELSVYQLFYNKKLLAEAGYDKPPKSWAELKEIGAKVAKKNDQGNLTVAGYAYGPSVAEAVNVFYSQMFAEGASPYIEDNRKANLNSPEAIKIIQRQGELFAEGITSNAVDDDTFAAGGVAMTIMANWQKSSLKAALGDQFEGTIGTAPIPTDAETPGTMLYSFLWAVDASSQNKEESWKLLKWLNEKHDGKTLSCTGQLLNGMGALTGSNSDLAAMDTKDSFSRPFVEAIESGAAKSQPNIWQADENGRTLRSYIEQVWAGSMSAEDAMNAANDEIQAILDEQP